MQTKLETQSENPEQIYLAKIKKALEVFSLSPSIWSEASSSFVLSDGSTFVLTGLAEKLLEKHPMDYVKEEILPLIKTDERKPMRLASTAFDIILKGYGEYRRKSADWLGSYAALDTNGLLFGVKEYMEGRAPIAIAYFAHRVGTWPMRKPDYDEELEQEVVDESLKKILSEFSPSDPRSILMREAVRIVRDQHHPIGTIMFGGLMTLYTELRDLKVKQTAFGLTFQE